GDLDAGLLRHLAADALLERLTELEHAPGRLPPAVVPSLDHQDAAVVADDDARDGDEVRRGDPVARCRHPGRLRSPAAAACPPSAPGRAGGVRGLRTRAGRSRVRIDGRSTGTGMDDSAHLEGLVTEFYAARARRDTAALAALLADDIAWHEPGEEAYSGTHRGKDVVLGLLERLVAVTGGTFRLELDGTLATASHVVARIRWSARRGA